MCVVASMNVQANWNSIPNSGWAAPPSMGVVTSLHLGKAATHLTVATLAAGCLVRERINNPERVRPPVHHLLLINSPSVTDFTNSSIGRENLKFP